MKDLENKQESKINFSFDSVIFDLSISLHLMLNDSLSKVQTSLYLKYVIGYNNTFLYC